jgi:hypothetical protein
MLRRAAKEKGGARVCGEEARRGARAGSRNEPSPPRQGGEGLRSLNLAGRPARVWNWRRGRPRLLPGSPRLKRQKAVHLTGRCIVRERTPRRKEGASWWRSSGRIVQREGASAVAQRLAFAFERKRAKGPRRRQPCESAPDRKAGQSLSRNRGIGCDCAHGKFTRENPATVSSAGAAVGLGVSRARRSWSALFSYARIREARHGRLRRMEGAGAGALRTFSCPPWVLALHGLDGAGRSTRKPCARNAQKSAPSGAPAP